MKNEVKRERILVTNRLSHITGLLSSLDSEQKIVNFVLQEKAKSKQEGRVEAAKEILKLIKKSNRLGCVYKNKACRKEFMVCNECICETIIAEQPKVGG
jgi:hypothetical protein